MGSQAIPAHVFAVVLLSTRYCASADDGRCTRRSCLPDDTTQWPPLCYTRLPGSPVFPPAQLFATCPEQLPHCDFCTTEPPCESRCSSRPVERLERGSPCRRDEECKGDFVKCLQGICRRALHTHQACDPEDPNDVCVFGQRSCFRNRCQGLKQGGACVPRSEGRDIDCNPGWVCLLGSCTPQLPPGHQCTGVHANECVRGYQCNTALTVPLCIKQYTISVGDASDVSSLCKTNHVDPETDTCAEEPPLVYRLGVLAVQSRDCVSDADCPRADGSLGECRCKRWWTGEGRPRYCELYVQNNARPAFKRFHEAQARLCHQDWSAERCARETELVDVLREIYTERESLLADPTEMGTCAAKMLSTDFLRYKGADDDDAGDGSGAASRLKKSRTGFTSAFLAVVATTLAVARPEAS
eukprot:TRINITY_DN54546_c0_g1_i1.p1 TRINITY_DN54546_c0_g1~~TRINITY_DN54546_c0_g1_i1.p1  ORF type:complete len:442 (+),score=69.99 TRINITY_DN54546_c0_g1_i1:89-1327(+)